MKRKAREKKKSGPISINLRSVITHFRVFPRTPRNLLSFVFFLAQKSFVNGLIIGLGDGWMVAVSVSESTSIVCKSIITYNKAPACLRCGGRGCVTSRDGFLRLGFIFSLFLPQLSNTPPFSSHVACPPSSFQIAFFIQFHVGDCSLNRSRLVSKV